MNNFVGANYRSKVTGITERINTDLRIVQCIAAYNEEEFIWHTLRSIAEEVDRIIVVEGAVENRVATDNPRSTDNTIDIIQDFKKNHHCGDKLTLIQLPRKFKTLEEQKQVFLNSVIGGDILVINDADEIYNPLDVHRIRIAFDLRPEITEIVPLFLHFYRDYSHIRRPRFDWQPQHQRVIQYERGMKYNSHPVVTDAQEYCTYFSPHYQHRRLLLNEFYVWHYGYARQGMDEIMKSKKEYYKNELAVLGATVEFDKKVDEFLNRSEDLNEVLAYPRAGHPDIMQEHPMMQFIDPTYKDREPEIGFWENAEPYKSDIAQEEYGNIWLKMEKGTVNPTMGFYHNGICVPVDENISENKNNIKLVK